MGRSISKSPPSYGGRVGRSRRDRSRSPHYSSSSRRNRSSLSLWRNRSRSPSHRRRKSRSPPTPRRRRRHNRSTRSRRRSQSRSLSPSLPAKSPSPPPPPRLTSTERTSAADKLKKEEEERLRRQLEAELKRLQEKTARRLEEAIRKNVEERLALEVKLEKTGSKVAKGKDKIKEDELTDDKLRDAICETLQKVDFYTATFTDILKLLAGQFDTDLGPRKQDIKVMILKELTKLADEEEEVGGQSAGQEVEA